MNCFKEYLLEQNLLPKSQIILIEMSNTLGLDIAKRLQVKYIGIWKDMNKYLFEDPLTGSSFTAKDFQEAKEKMENSRLKFSNAKIKK